MECSYTVMSREVAESWWNKSAKAIGQPPVVIPPEVAYYKLYRGSFSGRGEKIPVTWTEVMAERKKYNDLRLLRKQSIYEFEKPALLNVLCYSSCFSQRWLIYVKTIDREYPINLRTPNSIELKRQCFRTFPLGVIGEFNCDAWCEEFYNGIKCLPAVLKAGK